jgi:uncharacterized protein GlcG (DUF336 family)
MVGKALGGMVIGLVVLAAVAQGQELRQERNISLPLAVEAANAALQACTEKGYSVSVSVVDRAGQLKVLVRSDGAGPHTIDASRRKAYTSASTRNPTSAILENVQKNPGAAQLPMIDGFLILGGGIPLRAGDEVVGAIGVGGAPGGHLDDQCAQAGIDRIRERLK